MTKPPERLLVPTDFSDNSRDALEWAAALVDLRGATAFHLLHVLETTAGIDPLELGFASVMELKRNVEARAWEELHGLLPAGDEERLRVTLAIEWGTPALEILRYTHEHHIDLIAMGAHGRRDLNDLLMGSVAEHVVRKAPCAVLIAKHPDERTGVH